MSATYSPRIKMTITLSAYGNEVLDLSKDLISLSTSKPYGHAAGGWQVSVPRRQLPEYSGLRYDELVVPDDIIRIEMDAGDGAGSELVMLGLVNRVARTITQDAEGRPHRAIKISGLDMGKLLAKHDSGWDISLQEANMGPPDLIRISKGLLFSGTAAKLIQSALDVLFLKQVTAMAKYFAFASHTDDTWSLFNYGINYSSGPVWEVLDNCANKPYNTLSADTDPVTGLYTINLAKTPISDTGKLAPKVFHLLNPIDIVTEDVGACDDERVTAELLKPYLTVLGADDNVPVWYVIPGMLNSNPTDIPRHGATMKVIDTHFAKYAKQDNAGESTVADSTYLEECVSRSKAFWARMKDNHKLESGFFQRHLAPKIRGGDGLIHTGINKEYWVQNVEHHCVFGEKPLFATTLSVTRGQDH